MWWIQDSHVPALITTGVPGATLTPGVLGTPGTTVLVGNSALDNPVRSGGRFTAGLWLNDCQTFGIEGSYFFLGSRTMRFDRVSDGGPDSGVIARPFFDVLSGMQNSQLVAFPGLARGEIHLNATTRLQGADLNVICVPCCTPCVDPCANPCGPRRGYRVTALAGFRYLQLEEDLNITEVTQVNPVVGVSPGQFAGSPLFGGSTIRISDGFSTENNFYGGQVGAQAEACWGRMFVNFQGKVALGVTQQVVEVNGQTTITSPTRVSTTTPTGFLATGSNSGRFTRDEFSVVPEVGVNVGGQITRHLRASVGYTFLYWSSVVRPADQIDVGLSGTQIRTDARFNPAAGPTRPLALVQDTDFWAQGINFGLEYRY